MDEHGRFTIPVDPVFTQKVYDSSKTVHTLTLYVCTLYTCTLVHTLIASINMHTSHVFTFLTRTHVLGAWSMANAMAAF